MLYHKHFGYCLPFFSYPPLRSKCLSHQFWLGKCLPGIVSSDFTVQRFVPSCHINFCSASHIRFCRGSVRVYFIHCAEILTILSHQFLLAVSAFQEPCHNRFCWRSEKCGFGLSSGPNTGWSIIAAYYAGSILSHQFLLAMSAFQGPCHDRFCWRSVGSSSYLLGRSLDGQLLQRTTWVPSCHINFCNASHINFRWESVFLICEYVSPTVQRFFNHLITSIFAGDVSFPRTLSRPFLLEKCRVELSSGPNTGWSIIAAYSWLNFCHINFCSASNIRFCWGRVFMICKFVSSTVQRFYIILSHQF